MPPTPLINAFNVSSLLDSYVVVWLCISPHGYFLSPSVIPVTKSDTTSFRIHMSRLGDVCVHARMRVIFEGHVKPASI